MSKIIALQHIEPETIGTIADALDNRKIIVDCVRVFAGEAVPREVGDAAGLIVMGGPMGVYEQDRYPFLRDEIRLIECALREEKPVLGICLGSQLLASALGSAVTKAARKEIGWHKVTLTKEARADRLWEKIEDEFMAFHWHGDVFTLPQGAVSLASSEMTEHQAFRYGASVYGLLFHPEVTRDIIEGMIEGFAEEIAETDADAQEIRERTRQHLPRLRSIGGAIFNRWADLIDRGRESGATGAA
jgi:GMP synthase (glutamine-hydrolysing)